MSKPSFTNRFPPRRELGRTGFTVTQLGIGDLADRSNPLDRCVATVRRAIDAGLNLIDTAPGYEDGYSEQIVGEALAGGLRDRMFVIDKIDHHDQPVGPQVDQSLQQLKMDHTDLFVFHGLSSMDGWAKLNREGDGFDQLEACIAAGKTRFKGISSHHPEVLMAAIESGRCDVLMFPIGPFVDRRYVTEVLPAAKAAGIGTVCFKTFGAGKLLGDTEGYSRPLSQRPRGKLSSGGSDQADPTLPRLSVERCVWYTLTADPDVALLGLSFPNEQDAAFGAALRFEPLSAEAMAELEAEAQVAIEGKGRCWWNPQA